MPYPDLAVERAMKVQEVILRAMSERQPWIQVAEVLGVSPRTVRRLRPLIEEESQREPGRSRVDSMCHGSERPDASSRVGRTTTTLPLPLSSGTACDDARPLDNQRVLRPPRVSADSTAHLGASAGPGPARDHAIPHEVRADEEGARALGAGGNPLAADRVGRGACRSTITSMLGVHLAR
jgi:hypothetical protein